MSNGNNSPVPRTTAPVSRRGFLTQTSIGLAGASIASLPGVHTAFGAEDTEIKIGLIGCGGRGTGAVLDAMGAATNVIYPATGYHTEDVAEGAQVEKKNIQVVALADLFEDRMARCRRQLERLGIETPDIALLHRFRRLSKGARRAADQLRDPRHTAAFPTDAFEGSDRSGQACVHGETVPLSMFLGSRW